MAKKVDGVVEAAHLNEAGDLMWVRAYERRGPTWSDLVILDTDALIEGLRSGKKFYIGRRIDQLASEFKLGPRILLRYENSEEAIRIGSARGPKIVDFPGLAIL